MEPDQLQELKQMLASHEERLAALESLAAGGTKKSGFGKTLSLGEFLLEKKPKSDVQRALAIGYYVEHMENATSFHVKDIENGFRSAKESVPKNLSETINKNVAKGHMMEAKEKRDSLRTLTLTASGERFVESGFKAGE